MTRTRLTMSATDWLLLVALSILWGGSFFFTKLVVAVLPPLTVAFGRVAIAAAILAMWRGRPGPRCRTGSRRGGLTS